MNRRPRPDLLRTPLGVWALAGAVVGVIGLGLLLGIGGLVRGRLSPPEPTPAVVIVALPPPTATALTPTPTSEPSPTPTPPQSLGAGGDIHLGDLVEVVGTGGGGLRMRREPGLSSPIRFLAVDSEVLRVDEGPVETDGFIWWFLVNPYSTGKQGWGVADFLRPLD